MQPARFAFHRPRSLQEALYLKAAYEEDAAFYAGGTELLIALKARVLRYGHIIDIKGLSELRGISASAERLQIGALSTHYQVSTSDLVSERIPALSGLTRDVANIRVRVSGTIGGNLCFAEPHADPPTLLCALNADVQLASTDGDRTLGLRDFIVDEFTTVRGENELLRSVEVPLLGPRSSAAYRSFRVGERPAVGVAAVRAVAELQPWSLWVGAMCGKPTRLLRTEEAMNALQEASEPVELLQAVSSTLESEASSLPATDDLHGSADYKRHLVCVLARRSIEACL